MPTRRRVLQYGIAAAAGVLPGGGPTGGVLGLGTWCELPVAAAGFGATAVPEPFTQHLRTPPVLNPLRREGADHYEITAREADVEVVAGSSTRILGYEGSWPGPTIRAEVGRPVVVVHRNGLDRPLVVHLHGANTSAGSDGHPVDEIPPGGARTYRYPNRQQAATLWYHDHAMHRTGEHVYRGLAGFYLLEDPTESALGLPTGERDVPLLVQDRTFGADGALVYDAGSHAEVSGEVLCVNGVPHPVMRVRPTAYRLRLLNGSNSRQLTLRIDGNLRFTQVASDGGLLPSPVERDELVLAPAERVDVVVDFSTTPGRSIELRDVHFGTPAVMRFEVEGASPGGGPSRVPGSLAAVAPLGQPVVQRDVRLTRDAGGRWTLNDAGFDPARVDFTSRLGQVELWRVRNETPIVHPFHVHLAQFQVRSRNDAPPPPEERGWKDTVAVRRDETVELLVRFTQHTGTFVYHCHNLQHEDHDMMAQMRVVDLARLAGSGRIETAAAISAATFAPGVPVAFVATSDGFADALTGGPAAALLGGPVLLTTGASVPAATTSELRRLAPGRIVVLGGTSAVPSSVEDELRGLTAGAVTRLAGASRFATAAAISRSVFDPGVAVAYVATGTDFPDALSGGAAAAAEAAPVLLVTPTDVPPDTSAELDRLRPRTIRVLGGPRAVSDEVVAALRGTGAEVERLAGASRFDTAAAVSRRTWPDGAETVVVATGGAFPDALAGVPAAGAAGAPLLLVTRDDVPGPVAAELARLRPSRILVLGGASAVSDAVLARLDGMLGG